MKSRIKIIAMDVDGTLTDGSLYYSSNGEQYKKFNVKDGMGIKIAHDNKIKIAWITGRESTIVSKRAEELFVDDLFQNISDKKKVIEDLLNKYKCSPEEIAFIGDDVNDIPAMDLVGMSFAPSDASRNTKEKCDYILKMKGGHGAVRESIDYIIDHNNNC